MLWGFETNVKMSTEIKMYLILEICFHADNLNIDFTLKKT